MNYFLSVNVKEDGNDTFTEVTYVFVSDRPIVSIPNGDVTTHYLYFGNEDSIVIKEVCGEIHLPETILHNQPVCLHESHNFVKSDSIKVTYQHKYWKEAYKGPSFVELQNSILEKYEARATSALEMLIEVNRCLINKVYLVGSKVMEKKHNPTLWKSAEQLLNTLKNQAKEDLKYRDYEKLILK